MAFGKKKAVATEVFDQSNVSMLASKRLAENRASIVQVAFRLTGETPLLMNRWSQKAINQMVGKMVGQPVPRPPKDLTEEYENSYYRNEKGEVALPCRIIKASIVDGAITTNGVTTKAELKRGLRVVGYTTPLRLNGGKMQMDCRIASNNGTPDMRSRAVIPAGYHFDIVLQFPTSITPDKVVSALEGAGIAIGLCEWRPDKGGEYGTFGVEVLADKEIPRILKECTSPEEEYKIPPEYLRAFRGATSPSIPTRKAMAVVEKVNGDSASAKKKLNGHAKQDNA